MVMTKTKFMQETGIFRHGSLYHLPYREKTVVQYIDETIKNNKELETHKEIDKYFAEEILDISDGFCINIASMGRMYNTNEEVYSTSIVNNEGVVFNKLFTLNLQDDNSIEMLLNSLCKAVFLKGFKKVNVRFLIIWTREEFRRYYEDCLREVE